MELSNGRHRFNMSNVIEAYKLKTDEYIIMKAQKNGIRFYITGTSRIFPLEAATARQILIRNEHTIYKSKDTGKLIELAKQTHPEYFL